jgi:hypothetical protein
MPSKIDISPRKQKLIVCVILIAATLAVFWQVKQYNFYDFNNAYITKNAYFQSGITLEGVRWAFTTTYAQYWQPVTWLSLMFDYQLYGLNAGGYYVTNIILHILSALLLFWLFNRMTGAIWKSAFVAAIFAIHPLQVETVAWIAKRRDILCIFFSMLTLCLYVGYTKKPVIKRYLFVCICFVLALMSKPMVVTLPLIMILLDYWPLRRFDSPRGNLILWQLREKTPFFIFSAIFSIITLYVHDSPFRDNPLIIHIPLYSRFANALVSFISYLEKFFWPHDMSILILIPSQIPIWQVVYSVLIIIVVSVFVIKTWRRFPYLFVGWLWFAITIAPVLGIIPYGILAMSDHHTYLPSVGIAIMLAWGIPLLFPGEGIRNKTLMPASIAFLAMMMALAWHQCGYWKNAVELSSHACLITENNYLAHNERGLAYADLGQYQQAIEDFNEAIRIKPSAQYYYNRGSAYDRLGRYERAVADYSEAIRLEQNSFIALSYAAYTYRAIIYFNQNNIEQGCHDAQKACEYGNCQLLENVKEKGFCR